jgi:hypothetical protein
VVAEGGVARLLALLAGPSDLLALRALQSLGRCLRTPAGVAAMRAARGVPPVGEGERARWMTRRGLAG